MILLMAPYFLLFFIPLHYLHFFFVEDGIVEWVSFFAWLIAAVLYTRYGCAALRHGRGFRSFWALGLVLITLVAAGEEISWGQRVLGYSTPEAIESVNLQSEMNLHNLKWLDVRSESGERKTGLSRWLTFNRLGTFLWLSYLVFLPVGYIFNYQFRRACNTLELPVLTLNIAVLAVVSYLIFAALNEVRFLSPGRTLASPLNEYKETVVAVLFLWGAWNLGRDESRPRA